MMVDLEKELAEVLGLRRPKAYDRSQAMSRKQWTRILDLYGRYRTKHGPVVGADVVQFRQKLREEVAFHCDTERVLEWLLSEPTNIPERLEPIIASDLAGMAVRSNDIQDMAKGIVDANDVGVGDLGQAPLDEGEGSEDCNTGYGFKDRKGARETERPNHLELFKEAARGQGREAIEISQRYLPNWNAAEKQRRLLDKARRKLAALLAARGAV